MTPIVKVKELSYTYPDGRAALIELSFEIKKGEKVAVLGPNGAGKTTLMLHLNGSIMVQSGLIEVNGVALERATLPHVRQSVGLVFQNADDQLFTSKVLEDVSFGPVNLGWDDKKVEAATKKALADVNATHLCDRIPHHLSGGEKRRVALATALSMQPQVVVLDEPTSDLDPATKYELGELLAEAEVAQLVVTHDLAFARQVCERSLVMDGGRVVADRPTEELLADTEFLIAHRLAPPS